MSDRAALRRVAGLRALTRVRGRWRPPLAPFALALVLVFALVLGGCGAKAPQAPPALANKVASALEGIAEACGESYQQAALPRLGVRTRAPEDAASMRALELAHVVLLNRAWIYQGETLSEVAALARERLKECGLERAASELQQLTAGAR